MGYIESEKQTPVAGLAGIYRWLALGLLLFIGIMALVSANRSIHLEQQEQQKVRLEKATRLIQSRLNTAIQIPLNTVASMQAFMLASPQLPDFDSFNRFAASMLHRTPAVGGFAFVDADQIIRHFYPLAGNEKAINLDLKTRPAAESVAKAIRNRRITMNPPAVTVQGHLSTIARIPLFRGDKMLGLVQGVIDIEKTLQMITQDLDDDVRVSLANSAGKPFWGPREYPEDLMPLEIKVADTHWQLRVWLASNLAKNSEHMALVVWLVGSALLFSLLFIVNRSFTEEKRLSLAVHSKTAQLAASESRWRSLLERVHLIGIGLDRQGYVSYANPFFYRMSGYKAKEVIGKNWFENFLPPVSKTSVGNTFEKLRDGDVTNQYLNQIVTKNGQERTISWFNVRVADEENNFDGTISIGEDITARQELEQRLDYLAYHDILTGLPNRTLFIDRLEHAVKRAQRDNTLLALMVIDLDQFKNVNDSLGHFAGDILLQDVANRFHHVIRSADTVARLGGDEFTVLLENINNVDIVEDVAGKILQEFSESFEVEKNRLYITASIGIVLYPMGDDQIDDLLRAADTAMYHAKAVGRNCYQFYHADMAALAHNQLNLANSLHDALNNHELSLVFQPVLNLATGSTTGMEALLRWKHPEFGEVPPSEFIPIAESTGLIVNIGYWILREACSSYNSLDMELRHNVSMAVNFSGHQFRDKRFVETVREILAEENMQASNLLVEITESQLMEETQVALQALQQLRELGCRIAIDDFGTGYSSLSYLRVFPVDVLKIDRSFIDDLTHDKNSQILLKAILMIASSLGIEVIAEGLETDEQLTILESLGVVYAQGYLLGRPEQLSKLDFSVKLQKA